MNYTDYEEIEEDEYSDEYWEDDEQEVFVTTRAKLYPSNLVFKNRRNHRSESQSEATPPFIFPLEDSTSILMEVEKQRKKRGKLLPALIEQLTEFNVSEYLQNLPCGLSVRQTAHEIPKYRSELIRAVR